jgi:hypothetical protein
MEPIQILEAIKEDIRDKFDGDPLMMRTMNLVITEYKARSERLHKPVVMQAEGSDGAEGAAVGQRSVDTNAEVRDCETCKHLLSHESYPCVKCDENYSMWEAPSGGHLRLARCPIVHNVGYNRSWGI